MCQHLYAIDLANCPWCSAAAPPAAAGQPLEADQDRQIVAMKAENTRLRQRNTALAAAVKSRDSRIAGFVRLMRLGGPGRGHRS